MSGVPSTRLPRDCSSDPTASSLADRWTTCLRGRGGEGEYAQQRDERTRESVSGHCVQPSLIERIAHESLEAQLLRVYTD